MSDYTVVIKGFKSLEAARMFCEWYEGSGEQELSCWADESEDQTFENTFIVRMKHPWIVFDKESKTLTFTVT